MAMAPELGEINSGHVLRRERLLHSLRHQRQRAGGNLREVAAQNLLLHAATLHERQAAGRLAAHEAGEGAAVLRLDVVGEKIRIEGRVRVEDGEDEIRHALARELREVRPDGASRA